MLSPRKKKPKTMRKQKKKRTKNRQKQMGRPIKFDDPDDSYHRVQREKMRKLREKKKKNDVIAKGRYVLEKRS